MENGKKTTQTVAHTKSKMKIKIVLNFWPMFPPIFPFCSSSAPDYAAAEAPLTLTDPDANRYLPPRCWTTASSPCPCPSRRRRPAPCGSCTTTSPRTSRPRSSRRAAWTRCRVVQHQIFLCDDQIFSAAVRPHGGRQRGARGRGVGGAGGHAHQALPHGQHGGRGAPQQLPRPVCQGREAELYEQL